jgi:hypothetical protein
MRSGKSLDEYRYKYLAHADINRIDKVKELVAELKKRLPICGQFCLEELKGSNEPHNATMTHALCPLLSLK